MCSEYAMNAASYEKHFATDVNNMTMAVYLVTAWWNRLKEIPTDGSEEDWNISVDMILVLFIYLSLPCVNVGIHSDVNSS